MRGRLRGCTIGRHSVKYEGTGSSSPPLGGNRVCFASVVGTGATRTRRGPREEERGFSHAISEPIHDPRTRERARRSVSIPQRSLLGRIITFRAGIAMPWPRLHRAKRLLGSFRRLRFDVFSRTPVAARSLSLTLEPYAGWTVTRTCTPRLIYERLAPF